MHTPFAPVPAMPSEWLYGFGSVLIGGAVLPFLLSLLLDALALGIQRRRWRLLVGLLAVTGATQGSLWWTLSLARTSPTAYEVDWPEFVAILFGVGMVVALWHGMPRVLRAVLRRRREDRDRLDRSAVVHEPGRPAPLPTESATGAEALAANEVLLAPEPRSEELALAD
jgi:hypothetical protein